MQSEEVAGPCAPDPLYTAPKSCDARLQCSPTAGTACHSAKQVKSTSISHKIENQFHLEEKKKTISNNIHMIQGMRLSTEQ